MGKTFEQILEQSRAAGASHHRMVARLGGKGVMSTKEEQMADEAEKQEKTTNVMRAEYRPLSDEDKAILAEIKARGTSFWEYLDAFGHTREVALAKTKIEEAVMWAVKHVTK